MSGLLLLAKHARDRGAAGGNALLRANIFPMTGGGPTGPGDTRNHGFLNPLGDRLLTVQPLAAEAAAELDDLAQPGPAFAAAGALLVNEIGQAFGVAEMASSPAMGSCDGPIGASSSIPGPPVRRSSRLTRHLLLVEVRRKRLGRPGRLAADAAPLALHQLAHRLTPRLLVGRVDEHAVDVEDRCLEPGRHGSSCQPWACCPGLGSGSSSNVHRSPARSSRTWSRTATLTGGLTPSRSAATVSRPSANVTRIRVR